MHPMNLITFPKPAVSDFYLCSSISAPKSGCQKWHQYPESPTRTQLLCPNFPLTLWWIGHLERVSPGRVLINERAMRLRYSDETRGGGERRETNGSDGEEEETEGGNGLQKQQRQENKQQGEKNKWEKRERRRRSSEAPKVLELIKMICIYLWGLMSSFSMVCFPLIWIFPFHYVT